MLRRVTLHQLRLMASLARHMNMTRAAEEMHMTASAFSVQIKQLSESLGLPLHEQAGKKLFLTEAGRAAAAASREMLERLDLLGMELAEMQGFERGCLRLAMITTARYFATRLIGDFCRDHPKVELVLEVVNRDQILERMRQNLDDLYIMGRPPEDQDVARFPSLKIRWSCSRPPAIRSARNGASSRSGSTAKRSSCASRVRERVR